MAILNGLPNTRLHQTARHFLSAYEGAPLVLKAAQARDAAGEAAVFASDGVAYRKHVDPLVGPAAFLAYVTKFETDNPKLNVAWSTDAIRIAESGDLAIQTGEYHLT